MITLFDDFANGHGVFINVEDETVKIVRFLLCGHGLSKLIDGGTNAIKGEGRSSFRCCFSTR